mgnify:CR=1 FL=1
MAEVDADHSMTERLVRWMGRQSIEYTYAEVAKQVGVDEKTVRNIFDAYVASLEKQFQRETPIWLGVDEIKLGRFRAIFTNIHGRTLIDMLPDRYSTSIERFMNSLPNKEQITHVACDMWRPYRQAAQRVLPQAKIVVDKFHVVSKANASFDAVRRSIGKADQKKQGAGLKKAHKLFAKRAADLDDEQYLTVSGWLNCFPLLATAYDLKERLYKVYEVETKEEAWGEYLTWEASIPDELAKPFRPVKTAFRNWKTYILNYFDDAQNAFVSAYRKSTKDGKFTVKVEYISCGELEGKTLLLVDPMLATGSSLVLAYNALCERGGQPAHTHVAAVIASEQGVEYVEKNMPKRTTTIWCAAVDEELTSRAYIVPGIGDAGDLAYGEKI